MSRKQKVKFVQIAMNSYGGITAIDVQGRPWRTFKWDDVWAPWELIPQPDEPDGD